MVLSSPPCVWMLLRPRLSYRALIRRQLQCGLIETSSPIALDLALYIPSLSCAWLYRPAVRWLHLDWRLLGAERVPPRYRSFYFVFNRYFTTTAVGPTHTLGQAVSCAYIRMEKKRLWAFSKRKHIVHSFREKEDLLDFRHGESMYVRTYMGGISSFIRYI